MLHFPLSRTLLAIGAALALTQAVWAAPSCSPWSSSQVYNAGDYATFSGKTWRASWWTQGEQPGSSQWGAWQERPASE
ncbi:chitinase, partial [Chromobacterium piscinae]